MPTSRTAASPFGRTVLVTGPESLLADRAVQEVLVRARQEDPDVQVAEVEAGSLDVGRLAEITGASLFASRAAAVVRDLANLPAELGDAVATLAVDPPPELALVLVHAGGAKGKALLDRLRRSAVVVDCPSIRPWELPQFVQGEARRRGTSIDTDAAQELVEAVGHDLRALAQAVAQLESDGDGGPIRVALVRRYFGGRSEVTSFAVADAALAGRADRAMEQLRWAMSTGVPPVLVTSAMAVGLRGLGRLITAGGGLREADLARAAGVPPWKLKSMRVQARGWDQRGVAEALQAVATADAQVKGAADSPEYALEQLVLAVTRSRG